VLALSAILLVGGCGQATPASSPPLASPVSTTTETTSVTTVTRAPVTATTTATAGPVTVTVTPTDFPAAYLSAVRKQEPTLSTMPDSALLQFGNQTCKALRLADNDELKFRTFFESVMQSSATPELKHRAGILMNGAAAALCRDQLQFYMKVLTNIAK